MNTSQSRSDDLRPGVAFALSLIRQMAAAALREHPTDKGRYLCLTDAAERLERASHQRTAERDRTDLFGPLSTQAAE